jgi:tight adherence protein C
MTMIIFLVAGIACLALSAFQLARPRQAADRERRGALAAVRSSAAAGGGEPSVTQRESVLLPRLSALLMRVHMKIWRKESPDDITAQLYRAGVSRRLSAEKFMAGRVLLTFLGLVVGFSIAEGSRKIVLALLFGFAGLYLPTFFLKKAAASRADRIDAELPNFVDQVAIAIEAGMSFDAALSHLIEAQDGPLAEEMARILTELRIGESRRTALRSFAERVGTESAVAFANAVLASDDLGSPLAGILRAQAADLRHRRQMHAEERAQKAPVKMLFPIAIFILPVMFVVILAPAFLGGGIF